MFSRKNNLHCVYLIVFITTTEIKARFEKGIIPYYILISTGKRSHNPLPKKPLFTANREYLKTTTRHNAEMNGS